MSSEVEKVERFRKMTDGEFKTSSFTLEKYRLVPGWWNDNQPCDPVAALAAYDEASRAGFRPGLFPFPKIFWFYLLSLGIISIIIILLSLYMELSSNFLFSMFLVTLGLTVIVFIILIKIVNRNDHYQFEFEKQVSKISRFLKFLSTLAEMCDCHPDQVEQFFKETQTTLGRYAEAAIIYRLTQVIMAEGRLKKLCRIVNDGGINVCDIQNEVSVIIGAKSKGADIWQKFKELGIIDSPLASYWQSAKDKLRAANPPAN